MATLKESKTSSPVLSLAFTVDYHQSGLLAGYEGMHMKSDVCCFVVVKGGGRGAVLYIRMLITLTIQIIYINI